MELNLHWQHSAQAQPDMAERVKCFGSREDERIPGQASPSRYSSNTFFDDLQFFLYNLDYHNESPLEQE